MFEALETTSKLLLSFAATGRCHLL